MNLKEKLDTLRPKYEGTAPRYTSYPPIPYWGEIGSADAEEWLTAPREEGDGSLSLYTHIPFCRNRCHYCGCFVIITPHQKPAERYLDAVHREMEMVAARLGNGAGVRQYHLGGGTPNFISGEAMARLVEKADALFHFEDGLEMSIELDPRHLNKEELTHLRGLGFNRISLGVQDFDEDVQAGVNRVQPYDQVDALMEIAAGLDFRGVNFDLIYGLPHQTQAGFQRTIERVLQLRPDRLALYNFAYLPQTFPHQRKMKAEALPDGEEKLAIFLSTREQLMAGGYLPIGMDHFARAEDELATAYSAGTMRRNFMGYTTQSGTDLLAFGVSAISEFNGRFWQNEKKLVRYQRIIEEGILPVVWGLRLDRDDLLRQAIISALFCAGEVDFSNLETRFGPGLRKGLEPELERLLPLQEDGLVTLGDRGLTVTELGQFFLRNIATVFDSHRNAGQGPSVQFSRTV